MNTSNTFVTILALLISQISANTIFGPGTCDPNGGACAIKCNSTYPCAGERLICAPGNVCAVQCTTQKACKRTFINANDAANIAVQCTGVDSCKKARMFGNSASNYEVQCTADGACSDVTILMRKDGTKHLDIQCTAPDSCDSMDIFARTTTKSQEITVWCTAENSCGMDINKGHSIFECIDYNEDFCDDIEFLRGSNENIDENIDANMAEAIDENIDESIEVSEDDLNIPNPDPCYDTDLKNPCTQEHREEGKYYFKSCTSCCNFIQCNEYGKAFDKKCEMTGTYWDSKLTACAINNNGQCKDSQCLLQ